MARSPGKKRIYHFELPYTVAGPKVSFARGQYADLIARLPPDFQQKIADTGFFSSLTITQHDLDRLSDPVWSDLAEKLGLTWERV